MAPHGPDTRAMRHIPPRFLANSEIRVNLFSGEVFLFVTSGMPRMA